MAPDDRERNFERALARNLRANLPDGAASSNADCPDSEILAAYHERLLASEEMISRKRHIASCARCQEILAQIEVTDEIPVGSVELVYKDEDLAPQGVVAASSSQISPPASPLAPQAVLKSASPIEIPRRAANWRWLAPAGALAAILLVWVATHERTAPPMQLAKNQSAPSPAVSPQPPPAPSAKQDSSRKDLQRSAATKRVAPEPKNALRRSESVQLDQNVLPSSRNDSLTAPLRDLPAAGSVASQSAAPEPRSSPVGSRAKQAEDKAHARQTTESATENPNSTHNLVVLAPSASQGQSLAKKEAAVGGVAAPPPPGPAQAAQAPKTVTGASALRENFKSLAVRKPVLVSSPDGTVIWRLAPSGIIERSTDRASNWTLQKTGIVLDLLAGSAPSNHVCWIVGSNGAILRTTDDGNQWLKVSSPTTNDVTSVFAIDAQQATISVASTNKIYKTTDGGNTWTPLPNQ